MTFCVNSSERGLLVTGITKKIPDSMLAACVNIKPMVEMEDIEYFRRKLLQGLRIPNKYIDGTPSNEDKFDAAMLVVGK